MHRWNVKVMVIRITQKIPMKMNTGTRGQTYVFELESFRLSAGVKTFDNSVTMMMYIYKYLFTKQPTLLDVFDELKPPKIVARREIDLIDKSQ